MREVVRGEIPLDLTGSLGSVLDRVLRYAGGCAAQVGQLLHGGLHTGRDVQHGAAGRVAFECKLERAADVVDVGVVT